MKMHIFQVIVNVISVDAIEYQRKPEEWAVKRMRISPPSTFFIPFIGYVRRCVSACVRN